MLTVFALQLYISLISVSTGYLLYRCLGICHFSSTNLLSRFVTGLLLIAGISQAVSLFAPVHLYISLSCLLFVVIAFLFKSYRCGLAHLLSAWQRLPVMHQICYISIYILLLLITAGPVMMDDTESYHLQMVRWLQQYGTVPGLAHLHLRYGFHSIWFNAIAVFSAGGQANFYTALNGLLSTAMAFYLLHQGLLFFKPSHFRKAFSFSCLCLLTLLLFLWPFLRGNACTANYEYITALCTVFLFAECVGKADRSYTVELFIWPVFLCTVRIVNFPMLLLSAYALYMLLSAGNIKKVTLLGLLVLFLSVPFFIRNLLLSGYPLYPAMVGKWTAYDWDVHPQSISSIRHYIKYFNRVNNMFLPIAQTEQYRFPQWIGLWARYLFWYDKILLLCSAAGFIRALLKKNIRNDRMIQLFTFFISMQIIVWFFVAPDPRFIQGVFFCGVLLGGMGLYSILKLLSPAMRLVTVSILPAGCAFFCLFFSLKKIMSDPDYGNAVRPYQLPQPPVSALKVDGHFFYIPRKIKGNWNARCYALPVPCVYDSLPGVHLRTKQLKDGFYNHNSIPYVP